MWETVTPQRALKILRVMVIALTSLNTKPSIDTIVKTMQERGIKGETCQLMLEYVAKERKALLIDVSQVSSEELAEGQHVSNAWETLSNALRAYQSPQIKVVRPANDR